MFNVSAVNMKKAEASKFAMIAMFVCAIAVVSGEQSFAFTAPTAGSFGYDMYDMVFNKIIGGPIGWVCAAFLAAFGISKVMTQWMITILCFIGAGLIVKMNTLLTSLGHTF